MYLALAPVSKKGEEEGEKGKMLKMKEEKQEGKEGEREEAREGGKHSLNMVAGFLYASS